MLDDWRRPGPTARQRRIDLSIGLVVIAGALLNVMLARSVGIFVFGTRPSALEQLAWALAVTFHLHEEGAFLSIVVAECAMAAAGMVLFRRGRWKKQQI